MNDNNMPRVVDSAEVVEHAIGENGDEGTIKRLFSRGDGSSLLLGTFRLEPGQRGSFALPHANGMEEETYYLLAGRLSVKWDGGELTAGPGQAIFFPPGRSYDIETINDAAVELVWTGYPAPRA
jgi:ethanolamine utilization protein EutQ (cupin superfamily)